MASKKKTSTQVKHFIEKKTKKWQRILGLEQWLVRVMLFPNAQAADGGTCLSITWSPGYQCATIAHYPQTRDLSWDWIEHTVIHEMLHLQFARLTDTLDTTFNSVSPVSAEMNLRLEGAIDGLTTILQKEMGK